MEVSITTRGQLGNRFDAEAFRHSLLRIEAGLEALNGVVLSDLYEAYDGPGVNDALMGEEASFKYVDLDAVETANGLTFSEELLYRARPSRAKYVLQDSDILVGNVRPSRRIVTIVGDRLSDAIASSGYTLLRAKDQDSEPEYAYAFLRSCYGVSQLVRRSRGSMYPAVLPQDVFGVVLPRLGDDVRSRVIESVRESLEHREAFFAAHDEMHHRLNELLEPYGCPPSPTTPSQNGLDVTPTSRAQMRVHDRIDAEFHRSEYSSWQAAVSAATPHFLLGDHYDLMPGKSRNQKTDQDVPVLKQAVLTNSGINWSAVVLERSTCSSPPAVEDDDVLLAATAHEIYYVGRKVDHVRQVPEDYKDCNNAVADLMIIRRRSGDFPGSYISAFLRHDAGRNQVQRCIRGLRGGHVYASDLAEHVLVPDPGEDFLREFEAAAATAHADKTRAEALLAQATAYLEHELDLALDA